MGKKFVVRLTEQELANLLAKELIGQGLSKLLTTKQKDNSTTNNSFITPTKTSGESINLNLKSSNGYSVYEKIADKFISTRSSNLLGIKGSMLADAAKNTYQKTGIYVPVELALAQLTVEGGFSDNPNARPIKTKNPFNVGNVDSGKNIYQTSVQNGIQRYYDLIATNYLSKNKNTSDLINNFVNLQGKRYATDKNYEDKIESVMNKVKSLGEPIYASLSKSSDFNI